MPMKRVVPHKYLELFARTSPLRSNKNSTVGNSLNRLLNWRRFTCIHGRSSHPNEQWRWISALYQMFRKNLSDFNMSIKYSVTSLYFNITFLYSTFSFKYLIKFILFEILESFNFFLNSNFHSNFFKDLLITKYIYISNLQFVFLFEFVK